jgi:hypothetical protein
MCYILYECTSSQGLRAVLLASKEQVVARLGHCTLSGTASWPPHTPPAHYCWLVGKKQWLPALNSTAVTVARTFFGIAYSYGSALEAAAAGMSPADAAASSRSATNDAATDFEVMRRLLQPPCAVTPGAAVPTAVAAPSTAGCVAAAG